MKSLAVEFMVRPPTILLIPIMYQAAAFSFRSLRPRNGFHDFLRTPLDRQQIGRCRRIRHAPALFPVLQRGKRNAIGRSKVMLRHVERKPDGAHVRQFQLRYPQPTYLLAGRMLCRLLHALDQVFCESSGHFRNGTPRALSIPAGVKRAKPYRLVGGPSLFRQHSTNLAKVAALLSRNRRLWRRPPAPEFSRDLLPSRPRLISILARAGTASPNAAGS